MKKDQFVSQEFLGVVWGYYLAHGRITLPWRVADAHGAFDAYHILVSELMLQQTQVPRVIPKYQAFLSEFPTVMDLADANLATVLRAWQGLGYNRRAKFLWQAAIMVRDVYGGVIPRTSKELEALPGVGKNTAAAILAYAYDQPVIFVETNVRTVIIHHFFADQTGIADAQIIAILQPVVDLAAADHTIGARQFYWALMDYGSFLKQTVGNLNRHSTTYAKQSTFQGSRRQVRGQVLRSLAAGTKTITELEAQIVDERLPAVINELITEEFIECVGRTVRLCD